MLVRMMPEQIARYWSMISHAVQSAAPPTVRCSPNRMSHIFQALLIEAMQCWLMCEEEGEKDLRIYGVVVTTIIEDTYSETKNLLIYAVYSYHDKLIPQKAWKDMIDTLRKFAKSLGCFQVLAYSDNDAVLRIAKDILDGDIDYRLIRFEL